MRIITVIGTRPQLVKEAALQPALRRHHEEILVDTGQHYDDDLAGIFFDELDLAKPDHSLAVGSGSHATQVGRIMAGLEPVVEHHRPDMMVVFGDTNSTLAAALVGAKSQVPVAHVEAGLRSFDRNMPEEVNRVATDHLSTWLFAPTATAVSNLAAEGIIEGVLEVGDVMQDLAAAQVARARDAGILGHISSQLGLAARGIRLKPGSYVFATAHRAENRKQAALSRLFQLLARVAEAGPTVLVALHPGTRAAMRDHGIRAGRGTVLVPPVGYRTAIALQLHAAAVMTDSGGVQREAAWLRTPCLVLRERTEWVETTDAPGATSRVVGLDAGLAMSVLGESGALRTTEEDVRRRVADLTLAPAGASQAIAAALEELPTR